MELPNTFGVNACVALCIDGLEKIGIKPTSQQVAALWDTDKTREMFDDWIARKVADVATLGELKQAMHGVAIEYVVEVAYADSFATDAAIMAGLAKVAEVMGTSHKFQKRAMELGVPLNPDRWDDETKRTLAKLLVKGAKKIKLEEK